MIRLISCEAPVLFLWHTTDSACFHIVFSPDSQPMAPSAPGLIRGHIDNVQKETEHTGNVSLKRRRHRALQSIHLKSLGPHLELPSQKDMRKRWALE